MKNAINQFLKTRDGERIFFSTNFSKLPKDKKTIVFNYGLVCSNFHWKEQINYFEELDYNIVIHDYRGHFQSSGKNHLDQITFENIAKDLKEILDFLEIKKCVLLGHSMGVNVCFESYKYLKDKIQKMILISGTLIPVHNIMMNSHFTGPINPLMHKAVEKFPEKSNLIWKYTGWAPFVKTLVLNGDLTINKLDLILSKPI